MGVLSYFPGSEPPGDEHAAAPDPQGAAAAPDWSAPGVPLSGTPDPAPSRTARRASNVALATLTRHDVSVAEMRSRLTDRGLDEQAVEDEIARLTATGLLDDRALADRLVERLRERKGLGDGALRPALKARKLPNEVIDAALADAQEPDEQAHDRLQALAADRARRLGGLAPDVAERRLLGYLARKGYGGSEARTAARAALGDAGHDPGDDV